MNKNSFDVICEILRDQCEVEGPILLESLIQSDLALDSIGLMTFIVALEERFAISFQDVVNPPETLAQLVNLVDQAKRSFDNA